VTEPDGRRRRGQERRRTIINAALTLLEREGLGALTHRAVAAEAGVALASVTYHFDGIDDLIVCTILQATDDFLAALPDSPEPDLAGYAAALADELARHRGRVIAGYELYLLAARRPALREAATAWLSAGTSRFLDGLDPLGQRAFLAAVDSLCLQALLSDVPPAADDVHELLLHALR
jgi:DNA-binding transcriptional regulator YbjK